MDSAWDCDYKVNKIEHREYICLNLYKATRHYTHILAGSIREMFSDMQADTTFICDS